MPAPSSAAPGRERRGAGPGPAAIWGSGLDPGALAALPAAAGAYVLAVELPRPAALAVRALGSPTLAAGTYLYAGSARGPGGLRARIRRHLRPGKRVRWHIDHLTAAGSAASALALPGAEECELVARLLALPGMSVPVPGFGSSDCRTCPAHLLLAPRGMGVREAYMALSCPGLWGENP